MHTRRLLLTLSFAATIAVPTYASPIAGPVGGRVLATVSNGSSTLTDDKNPLLLSDFFMIAAHENLLGSDAFSQLSMLSIGSFMKGSVMSVNRATAQSQTYWIDAFTVTSDTLAFGTPVDLTTSYKWDGSASLTGSGFDLYSLNYDLGILDLSVPTQFVCGGDRFCTSNAAAGRFDFKKSGTLRTTVGATVDFSIIMGLSASGSVGDTATISALDTLQFFVDSATAGASYTTESGHTYFTPLPGGTQVPEPTTAALVLAGLAAVRRYRRAE